MSSDDLRAAKWGRNKFLNRQDVFRVVSQEEIFSNSKTCENIAKHSFIDDLNQKHADVNHNADDASSSDSEDGNNLDSDEEDLDVTRAWEGWLDRNPLVSNSF